MEERKKVTGVAGICGKCFMSGRKNEGLNDISYGPCGPKSWNSEDDDDDDGETSQYLPVDSADDDDTNDVTFDRL
jgi:hypothetical protein